VIEVKLVFMIMILPSSNSLTHPVSIWQEKDKILHDYYEYITQFFGKVGINSFQTWEIKKKKMANVTDTS